MYYQNIFKLFFNLLAFCLLLIVLILNCERADPLEPRDNLESTFTSIQNNIFSLKCALSGCHLGSNAPLGLDLSEGNAFGNLVNVTSGEVPSLRRVNPGDPENSYIVWKIEGRGGIVGGRMPLGRSPLAQEEINAIREWIAAGAQNN